MSFTNDGYFGSFFNDVLTELNKGANIGAGAINYLGERQLQADKAHMQIQLEKDVNEKMADLEKRDDYENFENEINTFLEEKKNAMQNKDSPYYTRNAYTAEAFKNILDSNANAVHAKAAAISWQKEKTHQRQRMNDDINAIMNRTIEADSTGADGRVIKGYSYEDRQSDVLELLKTNVEAGYFSRAEATEIANRAYSNNLTAQAQALYRQIWENNPTWTESEVTKEVNKRMQTEHIDTPNFDDFSSGQEAEDTYRVQYAEWEQTGAITGETAEPSKPKTYKERKQSGENVQGSYDEIDHDGYIEKGNLLALESIRQQQRETNEKAMLENEKLTTRYWELSSTAIDGKASNVELTGLLNNVKTRIEELESMTNFDINASDKRTRIRELYEKYNGIKEAIAYNNAKARGGGGSGGKEQNMSFRTYASQMYDFYKAQVENGQMTAEAAQQAYSDLLNDAITYNRGYKGETFEDNKIAFSQMNDSQKNDLRAITESEFIKKFADDAISLIAKSDKAASVKAKYDRLVKDINAHPENYSDDVLTKLAGGLNSFYFTQYNNPDFDTEGGLKALDDMHAQCFLESVSNKQALMPYRDKDGNVNADGFNYSHLLGDNSPNEKEIAGSIEALNAMDNAVYRDPRTGKDIHVNEKTKDAVFDSCEVLKSQIAADLGIDRSQFETEPTFKRDKKGDPTYQPQFHTTDGKVYEIRPTEDKKGYEIYDVTGGKEKKLDTKHVKLSDVTKQKQKQAKKTTKEESEKSKNAERTRDPLTTSVSKDLQNVLDTEGITIDQWNKKKDYEKAKLKAKYGL